MKKLVSLLIPVYNVEKFIKKCIESLFCQTYDNIEYVFVNDCTKDESMSIIHDIIEKYSIEKSRVTIVNHNENKGISITRNDCLHYAKGDYILFIDSDDWIDCDMIEILINKANEDQADIVGCGYIEEFEDQSVVYLQDYPSDYFKMLQAITKLDIKGTLWKLLIKRTLIEKNGLTFIPDIIIGEDYVFCCKLFYFSRKTVSAKVCPYHYVQYNPNNYSNSSLYNIKSQARAIVAVQDFYKEKGIYDKLLDELNFRKFTLKSSLLLNKKNYNVKLWRKLFPECNYMWKKINFSFGNRLIFLLALSPFYFFVNIIRKLK